MVGQTSTVGLIVTGTFSGSLSSSSPSSLSSSSSSSCTINSSSSTCKAGAARCSSWSSSRSSDGAAAILKAFMSWSIAVRIFGGVGKLYSGWGCR
jgi:hypothetical protein